MTPPCCAWFTYYARGEHNLPRVAAAAVFLALRYAAMVLGRVKAWLLLTVALIRTLLRRSLSRRGRGLAAFRENYDADGLPPVTPAERVAMPGFQRCIACGLCDRDEAERIAASGGAYRGLMALVLGASRSMPDFRAAAYSFSFVPEQVLADKELLCPTAVPFRAIARFVQDKAAAVGGPLPLPAHLPSLRAQASDEAAPPERFISPG